MILLVVLSCAPEADPEVAPALEDRDADDDGSSLDFDCDDDDPEVNLRAHEVCNGKDDDCDGTIDVDAEDVQTWFEDADGDGYGDPETGVTTCAPDVGRILDGTDCDDANRAVHDAAADEDCPGPLEIDAHGADVVISDTAGQDWLAYASTLDADYDGDGVRDLVVMMDYIESWYYWPYGQVYFFSGKGFARGGQLTFGEADQVLVGADEDGYGEFAGITLGAVPDVDGDGADEVLVVAPRAEGSDGRVYLLGGDRIAGASTFADASLTVFEGVGGLAYGSDLDANADFDGDGLVDPAIADQGDDQGDVYIFGGRGGGWPAEVTAIDARVSISSEVAEDDYSRFGANLAADGDLDGDGLEDLLASDLVTNDYAGAVYGYLATTLTSGAALTTADADFVIAGEGRTNYVGDLLRYAGDVDGDGRADLGFVASYDRDGAYVVYAETLLRSGDMSFADADMKLYASGFFESAPVARVGDDGVSHVWIDVTDDTDGPRGICRLPAMEAGAYGVGTEECDTLISMPDRRVRSLTSGDLGAPGTANTLAATAEDDDTYVFLFFEAW